MAQASAQLPLECWLDAALTGASTEEVRDDGILVGWWAENPECEGASAFGVTPDEARRELRQVLAGWVELGQRLGQPIPSFAPMVDGTERMPVSGFADDRTYYEVIPN